MRLLNITNRYYIAISLALMLIGNAVLVYRMLYLFDLQITDNIRSERLMIDDQLFKQKKIQHIPFSFGDRIDVTPIDSITTFLATTVDIAVYDTTLKSEVEYRTFTYEVPIEKDFYRVTIRKRLSESKDMFRGILITLLIIGIDVFVSFYLLNWWISRNVWSPFYRALNVLKNFDLRKKKKVSLQASRVEEFDIMNKELNKLLEKVSSDYSNLKEFAENMSHETQTPLAIIHSKLDLLMQSNLTEEQQKEISITMDAVSRLSKMNKALTLLAKIDNSQFEEQQFNIGKLINKHLAGFDPFIKAKSLILEVNIHDDVFVEMNPNLADILLSNLLSNAIRYNKENGLLRISFVENKLIVENSGEPLNIPPEQIFERFSIRYKRDSVGLGLAIVKRICDASRSEVFYSFNNNLHSFTIEYHPKKVFHEEPIVS